MAKLPEPPAIDEMRDIRPDVRVLPAGTRLYRIYFRGGEHPDRWNQFRNFGPISSARFDHHLDPPRVQERAILYAALGGDAVTTCVAEVFQEGRFVDTQRRNPQLAAFSLVDEVSLLSFRGRWPTRARASANINSGPRPRCRRWSKMVYEAYPQVAGLLYASSMNGNMPAVALYERAANTLPGVPDSNRALSDAALLLPLERIASDLGYDFV